MPLPSLKNVARVLALAGSLLGLTAVIVAGVAQAEDEVLQARLDDSTVLQKRTRITPVRVPKHELADDSRVDELQLEPQVRPGAGERPTGREPAQRRHPFTRRDTAARAG